MTGLSLRDDALVEVAALVTDYELTVLGEGVDVVIRPPDAALAQMGDFVREMHTASGLLDELEAGTTPRGGAGAGARLRAGVRPRAAQGAAGRQHGRDRPGVPRPRHGRPRGPPALPDHRRLLDQGAVPPLVPAGLLRGPDQDAAATAPSPTSASRSPSCATTARPSSCRRPARRPSRPAASRSARRRPRAPGVARRGTATPRAWSADPGMTSHRPERGRLVGSTPRSGYDGPRCGRNGISDAARPPWWV